MNVILPEEALAFNQDLAMDLLSIDGRTILHVVYIATYFGIAVVLFQATLVDNCASLVKI